MSDIRDGYYPEWLTDTKCGDEYKKKLGIIYDTYFNCVDPEQKKKYFKELKVYLIIVSDIIAYRYLLKHYNHLFHKLNITIEEYINYKIERMCTTIECKKDKIEDILSYVYISFMLSSPRLIYDYAESIGRCKLVRSVLPYYQVSRLKFFFIERENAIEHVIYNVNNIDLDDKSDLIHSNLDKYSLLDYNSRQSIENSNLDIDAFIGLVTSLDFKCTKSKQYIIYIIHNWKNTVESDYESVKKQLKIRENFTLFDYIRYKYDNNQTDLNYEEYLDIFNTLNKLLKRRKDLGL